MHVPLYQRVYEELRADIVSGVFQVGDRLPSEESLSERFQVSAITTKRALDLLRTDGLIVRRPRLGTFVTSATPATESAPAPSTGAVPVLGLVVTTFDDTFGTRVIEGILDAAGTRANVMLKRTRGDLDLEDGHVRALVASGVDGLLLLPSSSQFIPPAVLELVSRKFPVVILDRVFDGVPVSSVSSDNIGGAKAATEHLFALGHEKLAMVSASSQVSTVTQRRQGFVRAHAEGQVPLTEGDDLHSLGATVPGSSGDVDTDLATLESYIASHPEFTGYVVAEYNLAVLLREACHRLGLEVPNDVSIACFDHPLAFTDRELFRFTHVSQDQATIGARAVEHLLAQIREPSKIERIVLPTTLVVGQSTGPAPTTARRA